MPQPPFNPPTYVCYKAPAPIKIDGKLSPGEWDAIPWTSDFVDIEGDKRPVQFVGGRAVDGVAALRAVDGDHQGPAGGLCGYAHGVHSVTVLWVTVLWVTVL